MARLFAPCNVNPLGLSFVLVKQLVDPRIVFECIEELCAQLGIFDTQVSGTSIAMSRAVDTSNRFVDKERTEARIDVNGSPVGFTSRFEDVNAEAHEVD